MPRRASRTVTARIHRLNGQLQAIEKMLIQRRSCSEVLAQIGAVRAGIEQVALIVFQTELQKMQKAKKYSPEEIERLSQALNKSL